MSGEVQGGLGPRARRREAGGWTEQEPGRVLPRDAENALGSCTACTGAWPGLGPAELPPGLTGQDTGPQRLSQGCFPAWSAGP